MARGPVQAGNRTSKTGHYLQWWDNELECHAVTSTECKAHHYTFVLLQQLHRPVNAVFAERPPALSAGLCAAQHLLCSYRCDLRRACFAQTLTSTYSHFLLHITTYYYLLLCTSAHLYQYYVLQLTCHSPLLNADLLATTYCYVLLLITTCNLLLLILGGRATRFA